MRLDELLKCLREEDLPEGMDIFVEYFKDFKFQDIESEQFYCGDGFDFFRYLIKYFDGIAIKSPKLKSMKSLYLRYIQQRKEERPEITQNRLAMETGLDERTIRSYLKELDEPEE